VAEASRSVSQSHEESQKRGGAVHTKDFGPSETSLHDERL